ncbi:DNA helicase/exodeoxyribonuclease V gamma subunit [Mesocricetibacter intestinalis]|uniref:RecBCD enzyme subunit RecC n=1 Tax=Mesocricetibacter intestinalis TaxID=1521930 RepID=A0A4R6VC50_9PAST|nr:exodeoxyribonuclease V subunit gamma [Mesocricetibacter intestinalis]TDQ59888.1 DNA helicase/exodeoxyribonuclease V gamma subunit [Mesocricetibacter intestinalis]
MFNVYHSNDLDVQKDILIELLDSSVGDPFQSEVILVQSPGMAQWLQLNIADRKGIAANLSFPMPATFIWRLYAQILPDTADYAQFGKEAMTWRLMRLIPDYLNHRDFQPLFHYLEREQQTEQHKLYRLALKIADLFDQYLVYRPDWIQAWENQREDLILAQIEQQTAEGERAILGRLAQDIRWQGMLWRALVDAAQSRNHRANLHQRYLAHIASERPKNLPARIFIFGISALPKVYLETLIALGRYCDLHLFFNNPSREYWGDILDPAFAARLNLRKRILYQGGDSTSLFSQQQLTELAAEQWETGDEGEKLQVGHPLLAMWGKLGRDFLYLLTEAQPDQEISAFVPQQPDLSAPAPLLSQIQQRILALAPNQAAMLHLAPRDESLSLHACHSEMREVEVLHDYLLHLFKREPDLTPKDIVVMVADIDKYTPYIQAVFGQYRSDLGQGNGNRDKRYIPFSISDNKLSATEVLVSAFLSLLNLKTSRFSAEEVLAFLDIPAIRQRFGIENDELEQIHRWVEDCVIRFGLDKYPTAADTNYNAWQSGLERMLLGYAMGEENGVWQDTLGFDGSYGLSGKSAGRLAEFINALYHWHHCLQQPHKIDEWYLYLNALIEDFFYSDEQSGDILLYLKNCIQQFSEQLQGFGFSQPLDIDVVADSLCERLDSNHNGLSFLVGKVNFCTLLPMRSIPFKVICLLGMNETDYPRQQTPNGFDLMQYHHLKGDRSRRNDDRYLFLEALLAAQDYLYISYIGRSIVDNEVLEPSILVNQLLDYLYENLPDYPPAKDEAGRDNPKLKPLVQYHAMTVFSPNNFNPQTHRTFATEWLPLANKQLSPLREFNQPLKGIAEREKEIELKRLISFVQHPLKFFFEQRLGVYFRQQQESIPAYENFTLDGLELYKIKQALLEQGEEGPLFEALKVKGTLPQGAFGQVYAQKISSETAPLQEIIAQWQAQQVQYDFIELPVVVSGGEVLLYGNLGPLFGEQKQRVCWYAGRLKDKFIIENWLYYLLQRASSEQEVCPPRFYSIEGDKVETHSFHPIEKDAALRQLKLYLDSYLAGATRMQLAPDRELKSYLKLREEEISPREACLALLEKAAKGDYHKPADLYWQRLWQQGDINPDEIIENSEAWFRMMYEAYD